MQEEVWLKESMILNFEPFYRLFAEKAATH